METLDTLRTEALSWLDETTNTSTTFTNMTNAINMSHQQRCTEQSWSFMLWPQAEVLAIVPGQRRYILHPQMNKPLYVFDRGLNDYLIETPWRQMQGTGIRWNSDTLGSRYVFTGPSPVAVQPVAASQISISSSSASDTGAVKGVVITGSIGGVLINETIIPNGVSAVTSVNIFDAGSISGVDKLLAWAGVLTVAAGATTLLQLAPAELSRQYPQIELLWTPQATDTIEYRFYKAPKKLVNATDIPDIPQPFCKILIWDALILMAAYDNDLAAARLNAWVDQREKILQQMAQTYLDGSTVAAEPRYVRYFGEDTPGVNIYG